MLGGLGNLAGLIKQARQMKENMDQLQAELERRTYTADSGAGLVVATVNGKGELTDIRIDPKAVEDVEMLEDLIKAAVGAAVGWAAAAATPLAPPATALATASLSDASIASAAYGFATTFAIFIGAS